MSHEFENIIHKYSKQTVKITNVRLGLICSVCGNHWGVALDDNSDLLRQTGKLLCLECHQKSVTESINNNAKDGKNECNQ